MVAVVLIPIYLATTFNTCCPDEFLDRLKTKFPGKGGSGQRSKWVVKILTEELDRVDRDGITNAQRERWIKECVIPALNSLLKEHTFGEVYGYLNNEVKRIELMKKLGKIDVPVSDDDLILALHGVLSDYE